MYAETDSNNDNRIPACGHSVISLVVDAVNVPFCRYSDKGDLRPIQWVQNCFCFHNKCCRHHHHALCDDQLFHFSYSWNSARCQCIDEASTSGNHITKRVDEIWGCLMITKNTTTKRKEQIH